MFIGTVHVTVTSKTNLTVITIDIIGNDITVTMDTFLVARLVHISIIAFFDSRDFTAGSLWFGVINALSLPTRSCALLSPAVHDATSIDASLLAVLDARRAIHDAFPSFACLQTTLGSWLASHRRTSDVTFLIALFTVAFQIAFAA